MARILIVDDELSIREFLTIFLRKEGHDVESAHNGLLALEQLQRDHFDIVLTDIRMPRMGGLDLLSEIKERAIDAQVVVMTAFSTTETAVEAMRRGAYDYIIKPFRLDEVRVIIEKCLEKGALVAENTRLRHELEATTGRTIDLTYRSAAMQAVERLVDRVAPTPSSILLHGESGTGKEVVARMLHHRSPRAGRPFVALNCGAIPSQLMESELFGHVKGAFTGATKDKKGLFEASDGGTILLDEIGELSLGLQVKLLRVLQERVVTPVGTTREQPIDVRVIAASHVDLKDAVRLGRFRADLYYRLNVIEIELPPLRDRRDDIIPLAEHFLARMNRRLGRNLKCFDQDAQQILLSLPYYGNVRELENLVERAVALESSDVVTAAWLPDPGTTASPPASPPATDAAAIHAATPKHVVETASDPEALTVAFLTGVGSWLDNGKHVELEALLDALESGVLNAALRRTGQNKTDAAALLGISFRSFRYKFAKYDTE